MQSITEKIDALFEPWQQGLCPGGQVLVRQRGETVYDRCFGYADEEIRIPMTRDQVLHVASVSKQFTVMAVLLLQEDGKLSLEDDIRAYIPDLVAFPQPMRIRALVNNISGLRDMMELLDLRGVRNVDTITQQDIRTILAHQRGLNYPRRAVTPIAIPITCCWRRSWSGCRDGRCSSSCSKGSLRPWA